MSFPLYFLHIPRTAGTTTRYWLWEFFAVEDFLNVHHHEEFSRLSAAEISRCNFFSGHFGFRGSVRMPPGTQIVSIVRDAADRLQSVKTFLQYRSPHELALGHRDPRLAAAAAAAGLAYDTALDNRSANAQTRNLADFADPDNVAPVTAADLTLAKCNLAAMAAIGLTDRLAETALLFCYALGWPPHPISEHSNRSDRKAAVTDLDIQRHIARVAGKTGFDEALIEFARENFEQRLRGMIAALRLPAGCDPASPSGRRAIEAALRLRFLRSAPAGGHVTAGVWRMEDALFYEGFEPRFHWVPAERWIRWARSQSEVVVYLPLARDAARLTVHVELMLVANETIRGGLRLSMNGLALETGRRLAQDGSGQRVDIFTAELPPESLVTGQGWHALGLEYPSEAGIKPFVLSRVAVSS